MSFKPEVQTDSNGKWYGNALAFATAKEAESFGFDKMMSWMAVRDTRVVESNEPVNYAYVDHQLVEVKS